MAEEDEPKAPEGNPLRSVGERIGGWARRVTNLVSDVSGRPTVPEHLREPLAEARTARLGGDPGRALTLLRARAEGETAGDPFLRYALGITMVHDLLTGGRPVKALGEVITELGTALGDGPNHLLQGALALYSTRSEPALDEFRRAARSLGRLPEPDELEARFLLNLLAGLTHLELGNEERALRELRKARARTPGSTGTALRSMVLSRGVDLALASGDISDAESWVREALAADSEALLPRELLCRTLAAKGDRPGAHAMLEELGDRPEHDRTRVWVGLTVGLPDDRGQRLRALALRRLQSRPEDVEARRGWALAEVMVHRAEDARPDDALSGQILEALAESARHAPKATRDRYLQELAHVMLRLERFDDGPASLVLDRLGRDEGTAPEELRLVRARVKLGRGEQSPTDFLAGDPPRFRADADVGGPWGPDPQSPVRNPDLRMAVMSSQRNLAAAQLCLLREQPEMAQDLLVSALIDWPGLGSARELLARLAEPTGGNRLEDLLTRATTLLAGVPNRILGVSLEGVQRAMAQVVAARERLARPLTIAIMGEFSAGKSTFVNALLGEAVAPMGVLPTTTTINVFRRGLGGGARVHYRDGRISTIEPGEIHRFLHGLDDTEANRIRHVEIERTGSRMGDAAVVDTPGLNALDAYHEQVAREFLDEADAVVWVFSATRSGAASEVGILSELRQSGRQVLGVLNKVDTLDEAEQRELADYLRAQLGEVLVEVVPLFGRKALEYRTGEHAEGEDPFALVEGRLETHFLARARELKRGLTLRRLSEALDSARRATLEGIEALELRADEAVARTHRGRAGAELLISRFCDAIEAGVLAVDDTLTREGLGLGVLQTKKGLSKGPFDPLDAEYLSACFRDAALAGLQRALASVAGEDADASEVLDRVFVPWARGNLEGLIAADYVARLFRDHGGEVAKGEDAVRAAFREALRPVADAWVGYGRGLVYAVEHARNRAERRSSSTPRAEALRLRSVVLTAIETLAHAAQDVNA